MLQSRQSRVIAISALLTALIVGVGGSTFFALADQTTTTTAVGGVAQTQDNDDPLRPAAGQTVAPANIVAAGSEQRQVQPVVASNSDAGGWELLPAAVIEQIDHTADDEHELDEHAILENHHEQDKHADHEIEEHDDD